MLKHLYQRGVIELKSVLTQEEVGVLSQDIDDFIATNDVYEAVADTSCMYGGERRCVGLANSQETTINRRIKERDGDEGLIDIFHIDRSLPDRSKSIISKIEECNLSLLRKAFGGQEYKCTSENLYVNRSVLCTRGIHADDPSQPPRCKSFLYLTDVPDESYGPLGYIFGTHTGEGKQYWRKHDIETPLTEKHRKDYHIFTGIQKGDMIVASVAGAHRGLPQQEGKLRIVLVGIYDPLR